MMGQVTQDIRRGREENMELSPGLIEVRKDETTRLYEAFIGDDVVGTLAYETVGGRISLTHSYVDQDRRHQGIGSALARFALEDLGKSRARVGVFCGFVADYAEEHPEFNDVVDIHRSALIATRGVRESRDTKSG